MIESQPPMKPVKPAAAKPRAKEVSLDLATARQMLPYVQSIISEVVHTTRKVTELSPVQEVLEDSRRSLHWANRQRRYAIQDELTKAEETLAAAVSELDALGVTVTDPTGGAVEFPTRINGRPAAFSWRLGDQSLDFWHYQGEDRRRPIPADWQSGGTLTRYRNTP
jgi:hypothetical protein